jgi:hypothetical protein
MIVPGSKVINRGSAGLDGQCMSRTFLAVMIRNFDRSISSVVQAASVLGHEALQDQPLDSDLSPGI